MKTHILTFLTAFWIGFFTHSFFSTYEQNHTSDNLIEIKPHSIIAENAQDNPGGVKVFVLSNPTCDNCTGIYEEICRNLTKEQIEYYAIFYPQNNVDIWLASLLEDIGNDYTALTPDNPKLKLFLWLKDNKELWENMTEIGDVIELLQTKGVYNLESIPLTDPKKYQDSILYSKALGQIFNIQGIPTVVVSLVLSGSDLKWSDLNSTVAQMQQLYAKLKESAKVL